MEAKLTSLKALWDAKRQTRPMPSRNDFDIHELKPWLGHLALVDVTGERNFRLCGTGLFFRFGGDMTGQPVARVSTVLRQGVADQVAKVSETKTPISVECCIQGYGPPVIYSELVLPLSQDGEDVNMLLWASYPTPQHVVHPSL